jgi:hypothetical protein
MLTVANRPIYFNCFFFKEINAEPFSVYKIQGTQNVQYPFQLFKRIGNEPARWENLSIYATINDSVGVLLKELFSVELSDEVYHGQALIDPAAILQKIDLGETSISIYDSINSKAFVAGRDISFADLVNRNPHDTRRLGEDG